MKTIFITISRGSFIGNFFHTGVISKLLDNNIKVVILTPYVDYPEIFNGYAHENLLIEPLLRSKKLRLKKLLDEIFKGSIFNRTVHVRYKYRFSGVQPNKLFYWPRMIFFAPWSFIPGFKKFIRWADTKLNPQFEHDYLFTKYKPDLVFITSASDYNEAGILKGAKRYGVKSICMPKSWDNLSKMLFSSQADYMIVWNQFMKEQAVKFQDYKAGQIFITGIPQFDLYKKTEYLLTREEFCRQHNLDPNKKIILYGSTGGNCFDEASYIELIKKYIDQGELEDVQILIRPHLGYLNDYKKFLYLEKYKGIVVDRSDKQDERLKDHWNISINFYKNIFNSLHHSVLSITIASTFVLDSVFCGTPAVSINFDVDENLDINQSTKRLYTTDYIDAVTSIGGTWLANNKAEFLTALKEILLKGDKRGQEREKLISYFMHKNDGQSANRLADCVIKILNT